MATCEAIGLSYFAYRELEKAEDEHVAATKATEHAEVGLTCSLH